MQTSPVGVININPLGITTYFGDDTVFAVDNPDESVSINGTLKVSGKTTLGSTLNVSGATALKDTLDVTGDTTIDGTLDVTGDTTVNGFRVPEIQRGTVSMTCTAGETASLEVTFDQAFSGTPSVLTNPRTSVPGNRQTSASTPSSTGFTLYLYSATSGTVTVDWVAIY